MHRLRSPSTVRRFRIAALFLCVKVLLGVASVGLLIYGYCVHNRDWMICALFGMLVAFLTALALWLISERTNCPLCMTPVLARKACSRHAKARLFLGGHRLRVAFSILSKNRFTCPYCLEPTAVKARERQAL